MHYFAIGLVCFRQVGVAVVMAVKVVVETSEMTKTLVVW